MTGLLLALAATLSAAPSANAPVPVTIDAAAPSPPAAPRHDQADPCASGAIGNDGMGRRRRCAGLTAYAFQPEARAAYDDAPDGPSHAKVWVDEVRVRWALSLSMSVSSLYPEGSCPYAVTLAHETGHWNDYLRLQKEAAAGLRADLEKAGLPTKAAPARLPARGIAAFEAKTTAKISALFLARRAEFLRRARAAAAARDSPYAYQRNDVAKCPSSQWRTASP